MSLTTQHPFHNVLTPYNPTQYQSISPKKSPEPLSEAFPPAKEHDAAKNRRFGKRMYNVNGTNGQACDVRPILKDRWVTEQSSSFIWFGHNAPIIPPPYNGGRNGSVDPKLIFLTNYDREDPLRNGERPNEAERWKLWQDQLRERRRRAMNGECTCFECPATKSNQACCTLHNLVCPENHETGECACDEVPQDVSNEYRDSPAKSSQKRSPAKQESPQKASGRRVRHEEDEYAEETPRASGPSAQEPARRSTRRVRHQSSEDEAETPDNSGDEDQDATDESPRRRSRTPHREESHGSHSTSHQRAAAPKPQRSQSPERPKQVASRKKERPQKATPNRSSHDNSSSSPSKHNSSLRSSHNKNPELYKPTEREILAFKPKQRYKSHFHNYGWANVKPATDAFYMRSHSLNPQHPSQIYPYMKERRDRTHSYDEWKNFIEYPEELPPRKVETKEIAPVRSVSPSPALPKKEIVAAAPQKRPSSAAPQRRRSSVVKSPSNTTNAAPRRAASMSRARPSSAGAKRRTTSRKSPRPSPGKKSVVEDDDEKPEDIPPRRFARRETLRREAEEAQPEPVLSPPKKPVQKDTCEGKEFLPPHYMCNHSEDQMLRPTPSLKSANRPHDLSFTLGGHSNQDVPVVYSERPACCHITSAVERTRRSAAVDPRNDPKNYAGLPASYSAFIKPAGERTDWNTRAADCLRMYD